MKIKTCEKSEGKQQKSEQNKEESGPVIAHSKKFLPKIEKNEEK